MQDPSVKCIINEDVDALSEAEVNVEDSNVILGHAARQKPQLDSLSILCARFQEMCMRTHELLHSLQRCLDNLSP